MSEIPTLLVLGASRYQMDAIRTAQSLGCRVLTTDNTPDNPGHAIADQAFCIDSTDMEAVLDLARTARIHGILAPCTDVAVPTAAYVAEHLGLPGPPLAAATIVTDKIAFRRFLEQHDLPRPQFFEVERDDAPPARLWDQGSAWILKPDKSSGSKGIFIVRSSDELAARIDESRAYSPTGRIVIEQFLDGHQGTVEGVLKEGRIALHFILDRQTAPAPYVTTTGHRLPAQLSPAIQQRVIAHLEQVWALLGVRDGLFDADFVCVGDKVYLIEITPRLGGNSISQLIRYAAGVDLVELAVRYACGDTIALPPLPEVAPTSVVLLGVWESGLMGLDQSESDQLKREPWVRTLTLDFAPGEPVQPFINGRHRLGEAFLQEADVGRLAERETELKTRLNLHVLPALG